VTVTWIGMILLVPTTAGHMGSRTVGPQLGQDDVTLVPTFFAEPGLQMSLL